MYNMARGLSSGDSVIRYCFLIDETVIYYMLASQRKGDMAISP